MTIFRYLVSCGLLAASPFLVPVGAAAWVPVDFSLGPGGRITIAVDEDSTTAGCLGTENSECDSYSMKLPFKVESSGDLMADLSSGSESVTMFIGATGELCAHGPAPFEISFPKSSLKLTKTKTSDSAKFSGTVHGEGLKGTVMVPVSFTLKASSKSGIGSLTVKGLGQGLAALNGATVDVLLVVRESADDGDIDSSCASVPVTFKKSQ
ncbi:MAG TPA: hypothetical protein VGR71_12920 [Nitrospira sp.]|nr:hypothetical protein [Nitrospira sp.]